MLVLKFVCCVPLTIWLGGMGTVGLNGLGLVVGLGDVNSSFDEAL